MNPPPRPWLIGPRFPGTHLKVKFAVLAVVVQITLTSRSMTASRLGAIANDVADSLISFGGAAFNASIFEPRKGKIMLDTMAKVKAATALAAAKGEPEPIQVVTVRMPASLHAALKQAAREASEQRKEDVSLNKLCIEKLQS